MSCTENLSQLKAADFKKTVDGKETALFILKNKQGSEVAITNYGGAICTIMVPDKNGNYANVIQGHDSIDNLLASLQSACPLLGIVCLGEQILPLIVYVTCIHCVTVYELAGAEEQHTSANASTEDACNATELLVLRVACGQLATNLLQLLIDPVYDLVPRTLADLELQ